MHKLNLIICLSVTLSTLLSFEKVHSAINQTFDKSSELSFSSQIKIANNDSLSMSKRWDALIKASDLAQGKEIHEILKFSQNKNWFMRNALLVALDKSGTDLVYDNAKKLISDRALVVRSAAVDVLARLESTEVRSLLSKELNKNYNFVGKNSLWIRSQIMKNLIKNPKANERDFFAKLLFDSDKEVSNLSIQALEKITKIKFESQDRLSEWRKLAKESRWL